MALVSYNATLSEWENIIKINLKVTNPILLKSGALGVLSNYLAGIKYDTLEFYSKTFQEMNVGLAQDFNSMLYHSSIFGIELEFAVPAVLTSAIIVPETALGTIDSLTYTIPRYTSFSDSNSLVYLFESEIRVKITPSSIIASAWNPQYGTRKLTITKVANPNIPGTFLYMIYNSDALQYKRDFFLYDIPAYDVGEMYSFAATISNINKLKGVRAWLNTGEKIGQQELLDMEKMDPNDIIDADFSNVNPELEDLNIKYYKFDSSVRDKDLFLELQETSLNFETGDGIHGAILPANSQIIIEVDITEGVYGNIPNSEFLINDITVTERFADNAVDRGYKTTLNGVSATGSSGGKNIEQIDGIRENIFNQITIRNSIITENDYERLFKYQNIKPFVDAKFIDAKAFVFLFNVIHENDQVIKSTSVNYRESELLQRPFYPRYTYNGYDLISPFYYKNTGPNTTDAYVLNPEILFSFMSVINDNDIIGDYRVDVAMTYEFYTTPEGLSGKSYIEILGNPSTAYEYNFYASWLGNGAYIPLNAGNDFKYEINTLYTDPYCVVREETKDLRLDVFDVGTTAEQLYTPTLIASFTDNNVYHQLIKKQEYYKYFQDLPDDVPLNLITTQDTVGYLDNYLNDIMSTSTDIFETNLENNTETYLLRLPFISEEWFLSKTPKEIFEIMDDYFSAVLFEEDINYNTQLTQAFHNTIDIPEIYYPFLFEDNTMPPINNPKLDVNIEIYLEKETFITSKYQTETDLEIAVRIETIKFLKEKEGFMINYYETELEKQLFNKFHPIIKNVKVVTPTLFRVNNANVIYSGIQENLSFQELLDFIPPYFHYNYDISLKLTM